MARWTSWQALRPKGRHARGQPDAVPASSVYGREAHEIVWTGGDGNARCMLAVACVQFWTLPNVMFRITTSYNILRHNGVVLGKLDFLNGPEADPMVG